MVTKAGAGQHLRKEPLAVTITTECAHCSKPMRIEADSELRHRVEEGANPLIFIPLVNFERLEDTSIIDPF